MKHNGNGLILIMDDEEVILDFLSNLLETMGYDVVSTKDGKDSIEIFKKHKFKAVILDLTIPGGMGGVETVKEIRKIDSEIPIFVSSGYSEDPVMSNPSDYGFTDSLTKPYLVYELTQMLNKHLNKVKN